MLIVKFVLKLRTLYKSIRICKNSSLRIIEFLETLDSYSVRFKVDICTCVVRDLYF